MPAYGDLVRHAGNEELQRALELSLLACLRQRTLHVHVEGLRGTGKTTVIRAAAGLLGPIRRIRGCPYNCDPDRPHCPLHRGLNPSEQADLGSEWVPAPFLEVSASARIGTVVGSIDLGRLTSPERAEAALLPGTLARAHRGVVFVDEVNRLADTSPELADALLDVMGTKPGRLQIEEPGLSAVVLPCNVTVWAASNPDEEPGPLADVRRQLADRFDLAVAMRRPAEPAAVFAVLAGAEGVSQDGVPAPHPPRAPALSPGVPQRVGDGAPGGSPPEPVRGAECPGGRRAVDPAPAPRVGGGAEDQGSVAEGHGRGGGLRTALLAQADAPAAVLPDGLRMMLARTYCAFQLESLRAVLAWQAAAGLAALRAGRAAVTVGDLALVAPPVLRHRLDPEDLDQLLQSLGRESEEPTAEEAEGQCTAGAAAAPVAAPVEGRAEWLGPDETVRETPAGPTAAGTSVPAPEPTGAQVDTFQAAARTAVGEAGPRPAGAGRVLDRPFPGGRLRGALRRLGQALALGRAGGGEGGPQAGRGGARDHGGPPAAEGGPPAPAPVRLADPTRLPPMAPRFPARFLTDLPPAEMWTPAARVTNERSERT